MHPTDHPALVSLVTDALAYYRQPVSTFTLQVWLQACQPFSMEQVTKAMSAHATDPERGQPEAPRYSEIPATAGDALGQCK